jgi:competence protein ComEC
MQGKIWRAIVVLLFAVGVSAWVWLRPGQVQVHFIDVGQGDATLIITPHGKSILVDTGGALGGQNNFDIGERVVVPYLRHYGVNSVDWLILTHNHQDHAGGAAAVAEILGVRHVLLRQDEDEKSAAILRLQQAMHGKGMQAADNIREIQIDGVRVKIFQAGETESAGREGKKGDSSASENGRSNVPRIEYGRHSFLLTGDLEGESEKKLIKTEVLPVTVLKVGHHGARKSTQNEFLAKVTPQYAVISVGADNQFGHPAPETMHRLQEWPVSIYRTDLDGAIVFHSDGNTLTVEKTVH